MTNGRRKGSKYELKIAKILSKWSGLTLRRTPLSGGWAHQNPETAGDIVSITPGVVFPLVIECKNQEAWNWESILQGTSKPLADWWKQASDACPEGKFPLLIFSRAYHTDWVVMRYTFPVDRFRDYVIVRSKLILQLSILLNTFTYEQFIEHI